MKLLGYQISSDKWYLFYKWCYLLKWRAKH